MKPSWKEKAWGIHQRYIAEAQKKGKLMNEAETVNFLALAICGGAGELANLFKKMWRGDGVRFLSIGEEMADVRIYLEHLAEHMKIDLDAECDAKLKIAEARIAAKEASA